jgi:hypothetical protein
MQSTVIHFAALVVIGYTFAKLINIGDEVVNLGLIASR